jgi:Spy/CpxP family protein refolding chaperone
MNVSKYALMLLSAVLLSAPLVSTADMRGGHMMSDDESEHMMRGRMNDDMPMGMGRGGMGYGGMAMLDLDDKQRKEMRDIQRELRKKIWSLRGRIMDEQYALADLYDKDTRDAKAIGDIYGKIFNLRRQIIEAAVEAGNKRRAVLSKEQRERLDDMRGMMGGSGMGMMGGSGMGMMGGSGMGMMGGSSMGMMGGSGMGMMGGSGMGMMGGSGMGMMGGCNGMNW